MTTYHFIQMDNALEKELDELQGKYVCVNACYDERDNMYRLSDNWPTGKIVVNILDDEFLCYISLLYPCTNISQCTFSPILQHILNDNT